MSLDSGFEKMKVGRLEKIQILVDTQNDFVNAVQVVIKYDPKKVLVNDIDIENTFCNPGLFLEKEIDNKKGEVRIVCGLFRPGFSGSDGIVAELEVIPWKTGKAKFSFSDECMVLANDGFGTNVLAFLNDKSFLIEWFIVHSRKTARRLQFSGRFYYFDF